MKFKLSVFLLSGALLFTSCDSSTLPWNNQNNNTDDNSKTDGDKNDPDNGNNQGNNDNPSGENEQGGNNNPSSGDEGNENNPTGDDNQGGDKNNDGLVPLETDSKWDIDFTLRGKSFRNKLKSLMDEKIDTTIVNSTTYSGTKKIMEKAAAYPNADSTTFVPFYHSSETTATDSQCNREHVWPKSRGTANTKGETDPYVIRPAIEKENSSRGNMFYGTSSNEFDPGSCGFEGARGEAARVIFYTATMHYDLGLTLSNNPNDSTANKTMGTLKTLYEWNLKYPVTNIEKQINDRLEEAGFGRNPFVDHPEYVKWIWNENGFIDETTAIVTPTTQTESYDLIDSLNDIENCNLYIVSNQTTNDYYAMSENTLSDSLPWYTQGTSVELDANKVEMTSESSLTSFLIKKEDEGYTIQENANNQYLYNYIDGTHYSIGYSSTTSISSGSIYRDITSSNDGFIFEGKSNVFLEYYNGKFCGYKNAPSNPILLFK